MGSSWGHRVTTQHIRPKLPYLGRERSSNKARHHVKIGRPTNRRNQELLHCKCYVDWLENEFEPPTDGNQNMTLNSLVILKMQEEEDICAFINSWKRKLDDCLTSGVEIESKLQTLLLLGRCHHHGALSWPPKISAQTQFSLSS